MLPIRAPTAPPRPHAARRLGARPVAAAPRQQQQQRRRRGAVAVAAAGPAPPADLRQLLAIKEAELASLFESGRPMPQAGVVAALRAEIAALDDQLNGRPVQQYVPSQPINTSSGGPRGPGGGGGGAAGGRPSFASPSYVAPPSAGGNGMRTRTAQLADKAYEMVQQQLTGAPGAMPPGPGGPAAAAAAYGSAPIMPAAPILSEEAEIARLEQENSALRSEAYALLKRQQQLETMLDEVKGAKPPELLLETTEELLARMKAKLQKA